MAAWIKLLVFGGIFYHLYNQVRVLVDELANHVCCCRLLPVLGAPSTTSAHHVGIVCAPGLPAPHLIELPSACLALLPPRHASYRVLVLDRRLPRPALTCASCLYRF